MLKTFLKTVLVFSLLGMTTFASASPKLGEWVVKLWTDDPNSASNTWNICIQSGGNWYISSPNITGWQGKWFSKGNDSHFQAIHSSGTASDSFDISRINDNSLAGYYKYIDNAGGAGYFTTLLSYKGVTCTPYVP